MVSSSLLVTYIHSPTEEDTTFNAGLHRVCIKEQSETEGIVEVGLVVTGRWVTLWFRHEKAIDLFEEFLRQGGRLRTS